MLQVFSDPETPWAGGYVCPGCLNQITLLRADAQRSGDRRDALHDGIEPAPDGVPEGVATH